MAQIRNNLLSGLSGRVGNVVFYQCRGRTYVRRLPVSVSNPRTPLQLIQRHKIVAVQTFYKTLRDTIIPRIWKEAASQLNMSGYNLFMKCNLAAFDGQGSMADYAKVHFSSGRLPQADCLSLAEAGRNEIMVKWKNVTPLNARRMTDRLMGVVVYEDESFDILLPEEIGAQRQDEQARIPIRAETPALLALYVFFADRDLQFFSKDQYFSL